MCVVERGVIEENSNILTKTKMLNAAELFFAA